MKRSSALRTRTRINEFFPLVFFNNMQKTVRCYKAQSTKVHLVLNAEVKH
jgi:hypothetical protein